MDNPITYFLASTVLLWLGWPIIRKLIPPGFTRYLANRGFYRAVNNLLGRIIR
jgi:hypothetical protein